MRSVVIVRPAETPGLHSRYPNFTDAFVKRENSKLHPRTVFLPFCGPKTASAFSVAARDYMPEKGNNIQQPSAVSAK